MSKALDFLLSTDTGIPPASKAVDFLSQGFPPTIPDQTVTAHAPGLVAAHESTQPPEDPIRRALGQAATATRPLLEGGGAAVGSITGTPLGPGGMVAGGALGYAMGKKIADILEEQTGVKATPTLIKQLSEMPHDLATGATYEMGGAAAGPAIGKVAEYGGKVVKPILGKLSGVGPGAVEEALKSGAKTAGELNPIASKTAFDKALRGDISKDEIVTHAKDALNLLKEQRASAYQSQLDTITQNAKDLDINPIVNATSGLMKRYNVKFAADGSLDPSRIAMGQTGRKDVEDVLLTVINWGKQPGDRTAKGLDVLKRQLDDFYSDSSQARSFVASLRNAVKETITKEVPEYGKMTAGYSEATKLIKDVEADLMLRKEGMSGRMTADKTLRRLMSSMRDNFEMRKELVDVLGAKGSQDLAGEIAGYTMNTFAPRGLSGTGPALAGQAAYAMFNPKFWPVIAASSPRVQGEFLRLFGKASGAASMIPATAVKEGVRQSLIATENQ